MEFYKAYNISQIQTGRHIDPLSRHFREPGHSIDNYFIFGLENIYEETGRRTQ